MTIANARLTLVMEVILDFISPTMKSMERFVMHPAAMAMDQILDLQISAHTVVLFHIELSW